MKPLAQRLRRTIVLAGQETDYTARVCARSRNIRLTVSARGLAVSIPRGVPQTRVDAVLLEKSAWILKHLAALAARLATPIQWREGERLPYRGHDIRLSFAPLVFVPQPVLVDGELRVGKAVEWDLCDIEQAIVRWYRAQAKACFAERVAIYSDRMGVLRPRILLSNAKTRWGSCNARREVRLNWRLIMAPQEQLDYVVAHELAHLLEMNHSPAFWAHVGRVFPDYARVRKALRLSGPRYGML
ncbi:MAG: SprT family zinc-dependent metalloprotease [Betaproteobacteria bacterium]|nr:SprT family zinc-dependent metalloprotease [Betaproteobacteria bacterium]